MPHNVSPAGPDAELPDKLGRRVAAHRAKLGLTQQQLADRCAISRVALSHVEAGMAAPGERTVALLAGIFKVEPHDLVAGTDYPDAKAERLPVVVAHYTEVEHRLGLLERDRAWLSKVAPAEAERALGSWEVELADLASVTHDRGEQALVADARRSLAAWRADLRATDGDPG